MARIAVANNAEDLREQLTNKRVMAALLEDPDKFADHMEATINARLKADPTIEGSVGEQTNAFMTEWLKANGGDMDELTAKRLNLSNPNARGRIKPTALYNKHAAGAAHDAAFVNLSEMFYSISEHSAKDTELSNKLVTLRNAMSSMKPSDGGFLIPEVLRSEVLRTALETAIVRPRARTIPMDSLTVPFPTIDSTSNVSSVYGGIVGYWTEEGATLTESKPRFGRVELRAQKLVLYVEVPNELLQDARPSMEAFLTEIFPEALAWFEDIAFFLGNGTGEPLGFLNAPAAIAITRAVGNQSIDWADVAAMYTQMLPQSLSRAVWVVSPDAVGNLLTMPFTGGGTVPILLGGGGGGFVEGNSAMPLSILGRPVIISEKAKALGTSGDINFVDFGYYLIGDRQAMSAKQSEDFRFNQDVTAIRVTERVDGRPWLAQSITPQNGSANKLSPFIKLA